MLQLLEKVESKTLVVRFASMLLKNKYEARVSESTKYLAVALGFRHHLDLVLAHSNAGHVDWRCCGARLAAGAFTY